MKVNHYNCIAKFGRQKNNMHKKPTKSKCKYNCE